MFGRYVHIEGTRYSVDLVGLKRSAREGNSSSQAMLGQMHLARIVPFHSRRKGIEWLTRSAENNDPLGMYCLARAYGIEKDLDPDGSKARAWLRRSAELGNSRAQLEYGLLLLEDGADSEEAERWLEKAIAGGEVDGKYILGAFIAGDLEDPATGERGMKLLEEASNEGSASASLLLSRIHAGEGNRFMAVRMLRRASDQNHPDALLMMGILMLEGDPYVEQDPEAAAGLLQRAMELGNQEAMWTLGSMYLYGIGVPLDLDLAREYLEDGAEHDYTVSVLNLGMIHYQGLGVEKDPREAMRLFEHASKLGSREALTNMAVMYATGDGVKKDDEKARELLTKAKDLGEPRAGRNLDVLDNNIDGVKLTLSFGGKIRELRFEKAS